MEKKYYSTDELEIGIKNKDGIEIFPPIEKKTQNNLRSSRKIGYTKIAAKVYYTIENLKDYLKSNEVKVA